MPHVARLLRVIVITAVLWVPLACDKGEDAPPDPTAESVAAQESATQASENSTADEAPDTKSAPSTAADAGSPGAGLAPSSAKKAPPEDDEPEPSSDAGTKARVDAAAKAHRDECEVRREDILAQLEALPRACSTDDDCDTFYAGCPFGCGTPVANSSEADSLEAKAEVYQKECGHCRYRCARHGPPFCDNGTCRFDASRKHEDTIEIF